MKKLLVLVLTLSICLSFGQWVDPERYSDWKSSLSGDGESPKVLLVHNDYIAVQLDETTGDYGRYDIGTYPESQTLTYAYPSDPWSSWFIARVDDESYVTPGGGPGCDQLVPNPSASFDIQTWPTDADSNYIYGGWYVPDHPDILVYQWIQPVYLVYPDDTTGTIFMKYYIVNNDVTTHRIGALLQLDTMIDSNDAAPLATILGYSGIEEDFWSTDSVFPCFWYAYEDPAGPAGPADQLRALGILCGYDAVQPDRFAVGGWGTFYNVDWDLTPSGSTYWDSAVLVWWWWRDVAPGETLTVATYYGLGEPPSGAEVDLMIPWYPTAANCEYTPNPFSLLATFSNQNPITLTDIVATIDLPEGLLLDTGETVTKPIVPSTLSTGSSGSTGWDIVIDLIDPPALGDSICVYVTSPSVPDTFYVGCIDIVLEPILPPFAEINIPFDGATSSCADQELRLDFETPNGFDELQFFIDGDVIGISDPQLEVVGDELVFTPSIDWTNDMYHSYGLLYMDDSIGCSFDSLFATFYVDIMPPVASGETPPIDIVLGTEDFGVIMLNIEDSEREVDPSTIIFSVDGVEYTVADDALTYDGILLTFDPAVAGLEFHDGDTICCELVDAADMPLDYCEPNHITETYYWCFYINIVDIWLPDTFGHAGDIIDIPLYIEDVSRMDITSFDLDVGYFESVLTPLDVITTGSITSTWGLLDYDVTPGNIRIYGSGPALDEGDVLCFIRFLVGDHMGTYSLLYYGDADFNDGALTSNTEDGFFTVLWDPVQWSGTIFFLAKNIPMAHLTFGQATGASNGFDSALDIIHVPPPGSDINAWFTIEDTIYPAITQVDRDYRNSEDTLVYWYGHSMYGIGADSVWAFWNPSGLPDGLFLLTYANSDGDSITLDMKNDTTFIFTDTTDFTITFLRSPLQRRTVSVCPGWNLLSLPVLPTGDALIREIVPGAITDGYWYNPMFHGYDVLMTPSPGKGFWVFTLGEGGVVEVAGMNVPEVAIHLYQGWNMIGMPFTEDGYILTSEISTVPSGAISSMFWYDCPLTAYQLVGDTMNIGLGYFVFALFECNLMIGGDGLLKSVVPVCENSFDLYAGNYVLTLGVDSKSSSDWDMLDIPVPPSPPDGNIEMPALIADGNRLIRDIRPDGQFEISIEPGMEIRWESAMFPTDYEINLFDGSDVVDMLTTEYWVAGESMLKIEVTALPKKLALLPNRPNPFNAATEIFFTLPEEQEVLLELYDLGGKLVRTLFHGKANPGVNSHVWHGNDDGGQAAPSGVYFVKLRTQSESLTQRIMLIK